jgi:Ca2+-transporting ATPase
VRDGHADQLSATRIVPGDIVLLAPGDRVPADGRLVEAAAMEIDESTLTGASLPAPKRAEPPDGAGVSLAARGTVAYAGTTVARGRAAMVSRRRRNGRSWHESQSWRIARSGPRRCSGASTPSPRSCCGAALTLCVALAALAWAHGTGLADSVLIGVSLAVAAVPEGLPAV